MRYDELEAYKMPYGLALQIHEITKGLPQEEFFGGFVSQIRRSSTSICANIAEGLSKYGGSDADECKYLSIALGSAEETRFWLRFGKDINYLNARVVEKMLKDYEHSAKLIFGLMEHRRNKAA